MEQEFRVLLKSLRQQRSLSLVKLAERAQISPRTLSYWESGKISPRSVELQKVMEVLGASEAEKLEAFTLLTTRRGIQMARKEAEILGQATPNAPSSSLPELGDLLRAMRGRRGWTQRQLAYQLGVSPSTVQRWEISESLPSEEEIERCCFHLNAYNEETVALAAKRLDPPTFAGSGQHSLDMGEMWARWFTRQVFYMDTPLIDLYALAIRRQLRLQAARNPEAFDLLMRVEADYGYWLHFQNRARESRLYIQCALSYLSRISPQTTAGRVPDYLWSRLINVASAHIVSSSTNPYVVTDQRLAAAVQFLQRWLPRVPRHLQHTMRCDIAFYAARTGNEEDALFYLRQADQALQQDEERNARFSFFHVRPEPYYHLTAARIMSLLARPIEAVDHLQQTPEPRKGIERIHDFYLRSSILFRARETNAAFGYFNQMSTLLAQRPALLYQGLYESLAKQL